MISKPGADPDVDLMLVEELQYRTPEFPIGGKPQFKAWETDSCWKNEMEVTDEGQLIAFFWHIVTWPQHIGQLYWVNSTSLMSTLCRNIDLRVKGWNREWTEITKLSTTVSKYTNKCRGVNHEIRGWPNTAYTTVFFILSKQIRRKFLGQEFIWCRESRVSFFFKPLDCLSHKYYMAVYKIQYQVPLLVESQICEENKLEHESWSSQAEQVTLIMFDRLLCGPQGKNRNSGTVFLFFCSACVLTNICCV